MTYGFRLDHNTFSPQVQDAHISAGVSEFKPFVRYISAYEQDTSGLTSVIDRVEEVTVGLDSHFSKYWLFHIDHTQGFQPDPGPRTSSVSLNYIDECFVFGVTVSHDDTNRADISSGTSAVFHIFLKDVGGVHTDSQTGANFPAEFRQTQ
jgi:hypothetical protein